MGACCSSLLPWWRNEQEVEILDVDSGSDRMDLNILRMLGKGECGKVMLATTNSDRKVALKQMPFERLAHGGTREEWLARETDFMRRLRHPNIAETFQVFADTETLSLVLEYCRGDNLLHCILKKGPLNEATAKLLFGQLMHAVHFCHTQAIFHHDINLENIVVDEHEQLKLIDFEAALVSSSTDGLVSIHVNDEHCSYTAPEVVFGGGQPFKGSAADVWSCGASLFYMLTGDYPFEWEGHLPYSEERVRGFIPPGHLSSDVQDLLKRCLEFEPELRITTSLILQHPWMQNVDWCSLPQRHRYCQQQK